MSNTSGIAVALANVAKDLGPIAKRFVDTGYSGKYHAFAVDDIYAHLAPLFAKHGVVVVPQVGNVEYVAGTTAKGKPYTDARVNVSYMFLAADGSTVTMTFAGEGRDSTDKATNKAVQQALKYGLIQMFQIATGEQDPDAAVHEEPAAPRTRQLAEPPAPPEDTDWDKGARIKCFTFAGEDKGIASDLYRKALASLELETVTTEGEYLSVMDWLAGNAATEIAGKVGLELVEEGDTE